MNSDCINISAFASDSDTNDKRDADEILLITTSFICDF